MEAGSCTGAAVIRDLCFIIVRQINLPGMEPGPPGENSLHLNCQSSVKNTVDWLKLEALKSKLDGS